MPQDALDDARRVYAPPDHDVFLLVPPDFEAICVAEYNAMGRPAVRRANVWDVYLDLRQRLEERLNTDPSQREHIVDYLEQEEVVAEVDDTDEVPADNFAPLAEVEGYLGGMNGGAGPSKCTRRSNFHH